MNNKKIAKHAAKILNKIKNNINDDENNILLIADFAVKWKLQTLIQCGNKNVVPLLKKSIREL